MGRSRDVPSRHEVEEKVDHTRDTMKEKESDMEESVSDIETIRGTLESLDFSGTMEGSEEVEASINQADDVTVDEFDRQDGELDDLQEKSTEYEGELQERSETGEADLGKLSDASGQIETPEAVNELVRAKEAALRDIEFLQDQEERARDAQEESERIQNEQQGRARAGRR